MSSGNQLTEIDFYHGVEHPLVQVGILVRAALREHQKVFVLAESPAQAAAVEKMLYSETPTDFIPCCFCDEDIAGETPVVVGVPGSTVHHEDLLINLTHTTPVFFTRFRRLAEIIIAGDEAAILSARTRYRHYRSMGYTLNAHAPQ